MDYMIDTETLGLGDDAVILSIAGLEFDPYGDTHINMPGAAKSAVVIPYLAYNTGVDILSQIMHGREIEQATINWWRKQSSQAQASITAHKTTHLEVAVKSLFRQIEEVQPEYVWAMPPKFDLDKLKHAAKHYGIPVPWSHRQEMDVRVLTRTVERLHARPASFPVPPRVPLVTPERIGTYHDAFDDAKYQAGLVQWAYRNICYGSA